MIQCPSCSQVFKERKKLQWLLRGKHGGVVSCKMGKSYRMAPSRMYCMRNHLQKVQAAICLQNLEETSTNFKEFSEVAALTSVKPRLTTPWSHGCVCRCTLFLASCLAVCCAPETEGWGPYLQGEDRKISDANWLHAEKGGEGHSSWLDYIYLEIYLGERPFCNWGNECWNSVWITMSLSPSCMNWCLCIYKFVMFMYLQLAKVLWYCC